MSRVSKHVATVVVDSPRRADRRSVDDPSPPILPVETRVQAIARQHSPLSKRRLLIAFPLCLALAFALALLAVARAGSARATATSPPAQRTNAASISVTGSAPSRRLTPLTLQPTPPAPRRSAASRPSTAFQYTRGGHRPRQIIAATVLGGSRHVDTWDVS